MLWRTCYCVGQVTPSNSSIAPVVIRIYGHNSEKFIDRMREMEYITLVSDKGFGSHVLGTFKNGRIESFLPGRSLEPKELSSPVFSVLIAQSLWRFHRIKPKERSPELWPTVRAFYLQAQEIQWNSADKQAKFNRLSLSRYLQEYEELEEMSNRLASPVVLCHNDLLWGNFMYDEAAGTMQLIDFEYARCGYRGYDIGNHFNEYAGFECKYERYVLRDALAMSRPLSERFTPRALLSQVSKRRAAGAFLPLLPYGRAQLLGRKCARM
eukprot:scaffold674_cov371-Prasinococcus_capsulatus_cf.AAC.9